MSEFSESPKDFIMDSVYAAAEHSSILRGIIAEKSLKKMNEAEYSGYAGNIKDSLAAYNSSLQEGSILVTANHPRGQELYALGLLRKLNAQRRYIVLWDGFEKIKMKHGGNLVPKLLPKWGITPIFIPKADEQNMSGLKQAYIVVKNALSQVGSAVLFFPEGDQSETLMEGKPGLAHLAVCAKAIMPVACYCDEVQKSQVYVCPPIYPEVKKDNQIINKVMGSISSALPEGKRGFYYTKRKPRPSFDSEPSTWL